MRQALRCLVTLAPLRETIIPGLWLDIPPHPPQERRISLGPLLQVRRGGVRVAHLTDDRLLEIVFRVHRESPVEAERLEGAERAAPVDRTAAELDEPGNVRGFAASGLGAW